MSLANTFRRAFLRYSSSSVNQPVVKEICPTKSERYYLVWTGRFKKYADVPERLSPETVDKAKNKMRIKVSNYAMALTLVGCVIACMMGKRNAESGYTVQQMNIDWHKKINAETPKNQ